MNTSQSLSPGTTLNNGDYRIVSVLGRGGFGITYLAENVNLSKRVAIKEFFPSGMYERDGMSGYASLGSSDNRELSGKLKAKFLKEARRIASLDHESIVRVTAAFEENGTAYYVMDLIEGRDLRTLVKQQGPLPLDRAVSYIAQVGNALEYIHSLRINHLDVKPANILINPKTDKAVLIDFGLSKQYDNTGHQTSTTPVGISEGYAPIEQYKSGGVQDFSAPTDVYSLAATLYYLLTGQRPMSSNDLVDDELSFPANIPNYIRAAITRAMSTRRSYRHQTVTDFLAAIKAPSATPFDTEQTSMANATADTEQTRMYGTATSTEDADADEEESPKKRKLWIWIIAIVVLLGGVSFLLYFSNMSGSTDVSDSYKAEYQNNKAEEIINEINSCKTGEELENLWTKHKETYYSLSEDEQKRITEAAKYKERQLKNGMSDDEYNSKGKQQTTPDIKQDNVFKTGTLNIPNIYSGRILLPKSSQLYCDGNYRYGNQDEVQMLYYDLDNLNRQYFSLSFDYKPEKPGTIITISEGWRILEFFITNDWKLVIHTNGGDYNYKTNISVRKDQWNKLDFTYYYGIASINGLICNNFIMNMTDGDNILSSNNFSYGGAYHGWLSNIEVLDFCEM